MNKYIDAEKLKAEIERLKERAQAERVLHPKTILAARDYLLIQDYDKLLSFITSLQQEQPESELERVVRYVYESWNGGTMDDVRRDMVELGRVINARKDESK